MAFMRCYLCASMGIPDTILSRASYIKRYGDGDSIIDWSITGYFRRDSIQKITEIIEVTGKYIGGQILLAYKFDHGKLIEAYDENPGATYAYYFKNDSLANESVAVDDLAYFRLSPDEAFIYSREDEKMILNSEAYIKKKRKN